MDQYWHSYILYGEDGKCGEEMKKVKANKICKECETIMFQKGVDVDFDTKIIGWACPKCFATEWDDLKDCVNDEQL